MTDTSATATDETRKESADAVTVGSVGTVYDLANDYLGRALHPHREYLARGIGGRVLDLGGATGLMLPYVDRLGTDVTAVHVLDPNRHFRARAATKVTTVPFEVVVEEGRAESIPYDNGTFDTVVASQVFCTVDDVQTGLGEVERVLAPDGEFRFLEHVHADGLHGGIEATIAPVWQRVAGGCRLTRHTDRAIAASDLVVVELDRVDVGLGPPTTYIRGIASPPG